MAAQSQDTMDSVDQNEPMGEGEVAASPYEEHLLAKVMGAVYHSLNNAHKLRQIEHWMLKSPNLGSTIGNIAFTLLASIFKGAEQSGVKIPVDVFFAQGGAVYQTIERVMLIAEHGGILQKDQEDQVREEAMGVLADKTRQMFGELSDHPQSAPGPVPPQQQQQGGPPMMAANPVSAAVGQGLQQQGLMGGQ